MTTQDTDIPEGWTSASLGQIGKVITGKTPSRDNPDDWGEIMDFITPSDIKSEQKFIDNVSRKLSEKGILNFQRIHIPKNSLIITCIGSDMGKVVINKNNCITNQQINSLIVGNGYDNDFVYYKLKNSYQILKSHADGGSTMPILNKTQFELLSFIFPSLSEQKEIASILSSFDNKIELLRTQNETLEKTAQTIFQEWFGKYSVDDDLPEGWRVGKVKDFVDILSGFAFKSDDFSENGEYRLITIANVQDGSFIENTKDGLMELPPKMPEYCNLKTGDILLSLTGNVGRVCHVIGENYLLNQRVAKLKARNHTDYGFVYLFFRQPSFLTTLINISVGTAQQNLSPIKTAEVETIIPDRLTLSKLGEVINPMIDRILANLMQIQKLTKARDTLLPKLMKDGIKAFNS